MLPESPNLDLDGDPIVVRQSDVVVELDPDDLSVDRGTSAQARALGDLDRMLDELARRAPAPGALLDLGCGMGGLTAHVGERLGICKVFGADYDPERLVVAARRGVRPMRIDLDQDALPLETGSVGLVTSFGVLAYLRLYDNTLSEAARVLEDGGWLLISMPNLGSWANRLALLFGFQPHSVTVSEHRRVGTVGGRGKRKPSQNTPPLLHGATLRCMRDLLDELGFDVVVTRGFTPPGRSRRRLADRVAVRFPSLARRFLILARRRAR
jgi:SAM-dependent methyltransferase